MANNKIAFEEKNGGVQVTGQICGFLPGILAFTEVTIKTIMDEVYDAATARETKPEFDSETVGVFCAVRVVKNAFNEFVEEHADVFEAAAVLDDDFEKMLRKEKEAF